jgi:hypothetical protein
VNFNIRQLGTASQEVKSIPTLTTTTTFRLACLLVVALTPAFVLADDVYLKGGGRISGRITQQTDAMVEVDVGAGLVSVRMESVARIEKGRSKLDDFDERVAKLGARDREGWLALGRWASNQGLGKQARAAYEHVLSFAPGDPEANRALGRVELDGRWVTEDEAYAARGYVRFEGDWVTPAEREAILAERAAQAEAERRQIENDARVRDAELRAQDAEARAADAEQRAAEQAVEGIPIWWGTWGPGPVVWPPVPPHPPRPPTPPRLPPRPPSPRPQVQHDTVPRQPATQPAPAPVRLVVERAAGLPVRSPR